MIKNISYISYLLLILSIVGCREEPAKVNNDFDVVVRINRDIGRLNPILSNSSRAREVYQYVFLNLANYDPKTLKLSPVLAEELPTKTNLEDGSVKYKFRILEDAVWANGAPITSNDFLFTLKMVFHPGMISSNWKSGLSIIDEVILDPQDAKTIEFVVKKETLNTLEMLCSFEVYPEHVYDPSGVLSQITFTELKDTEKGSNLEQDSTFAAFANEFGSAKYGMDVVEGAGPYLLDGWETDQYIRLKRKENWWGNKYPERTNLLANPSNIIFQIIADETTALTQLKGGGIDVMKITNGPIFKELESESKDELSFFKPKIRQYFFIAINNDDEILRHKEVRQAIALCIDVDKMIEVLESGDAVPIAGTIDPFVEGYTSKLNPITQNVQKANSLLENGGWADSDRDGILDKDMNGKQIDLELDILASSKKGEDFGLLVKEFAKNIGMEINIVRKDRSLIMNDHIYKGNYQLYPSASSWDLSPYDPYGRWHSDNIKVRGQNFIRYSNEVADQVIEKIGSETDSEILMDLYAQLDEILYNDQAVIFLYSPVDRIVTSKKVTPMIANKRPGYFVNAFELAPVPAFSDN